MCDLLFWKISRQKEKALNTSAYCGLGTTTRSWYVLRLGTVINLASTEHNSKVLVHMTAKTNISHYLGTWGALLRIQAE
jgi:hypothetical protein